MIPHCICGFGCQQPMQKGSKQASTCSIEAHRTANCAPKEWPTNRLGSEFVSFFRETGDLALFAYVKHPSKLRAEHLRTTKGAHCFLDVQGLPNCVALMPTGPTCVCNCRKSTAEPVTHMSATDSSSNACIRAESSRPSASEISATDLWPRCSFGNRPHLAVVVKNTHALIGALVRT